MLAKFIAWYDKDCIRATDARNKEDIEIIFKLPGKPESRVLGGKIEIVSSSAIPYCDSKDYLSVINYEDSDDDAHEAVTVQSTKGGNFHNYPFPFRVEELRERLQR